MDNEDESDKNCLSYAFEDNKLDVMQLLLENGATINEATRELMTCGFEDNDKLEALELQSRNGFTFDEGARALLDIELARHKKKCHHMLFLELFM